MTMLGRGFAVGAALGSLLALQAIVPLPALSPLPALALLPALAASNSGDGTLGSSGPAPPPPERPAEKLPVSLPELTVIGHEAKPDVNLGNKLFLDASESVAALPAPAPARATSELLDKLRLPVPPAPDSPMDPGIPVDRDPYTRVWGGLGNLPLGGLQLGSYDLGAYHGQRIGPLLSISDFAANLHGVDGWSSLRLGEQIAWSDAIWGTVGYRREQQWPGSASATQESLKGQAALGQDALSLTIGGEIGRVEAGGTGLAASVPPAMVVYGLSARGDFKPDWALGDHQPSFGLQVGHSGTSTWSSGLLAITATDRFQPFDQVAVTADLGITLFRAQSYLDPGLRVEFRPGSQGYPPPSAPGDRAVLGGTSAGFEPDLLGPSLAESPTESWLALGTQTRLPGFDELYFSRQRTVGNSDLRPQRTEPRVEIGAGHRFTDKFYGSAALAASRVLDWIHYAPAKAGLWQPRNFAGWQAVFDFELQSQYLWTDMSIQKFTMRVRNPSGLGEQLYSVGTRHESTWLDDRLALAVGTGLDYVQLGQSQGGGQGLDWRADWEAGYRIAGAWQLVIAGKDWHVWEQEPSEGYFAAPAQVTAGVKVDF